jgi:hypothetical protein
VVCTTPSHPHEREREREREKERERARGEGRERERERERERGGERESTRARARERDRQREKCLRAQDLSSSEGTCITSSGRVNIELTQPIRDPSPYMSDEPKPVCPSNLDISILPAKGPPPVMVLRGKEE